MYNGFAVDILVTGSQDSFDKEWQFDLTLV